MVAASRYVARTQLRRKATDPSAAVGRLDAYCAKVAILEPSRVELELAAELEDDAARLGVDLDVGESQLCAIALNRGRPVLLTGDKRAIEATEKLTHEHKALTALRGRLACLEQAMLLAATRLGSLTVRARVLRERRIDMAVDICFQVTNPAFDGRFWPVGLSSYINDLRKIAPTMLSNGDTLNVGSASVS